MNPIFQAVIHTVLRQKRTCPACKKSQIVPAGKKAEAVRCKSCGADIPPRGSGAKEGRA